MADETNDARDAVWLSVCVGWRMVELYDRKKLSGPVKRTGSEQLPPYLPGFGEMTEHERVCVLAAHVRADLASLAASLGTEMPSMADVRALLEADGELDDVRREVLNLYLKTRDRLAASNVAAATGFGLGRMLADTVLLPTADDPQILEGRFDVYRLSNAFAWLHDLDGRLPAHAASAVRASLRAWEQWVNSQRNPDGSISPAKINDSVIRVLHKQGETWRRLLTGQQAADQLLDGRAYVGAAASLIANGRRIVFHFLWKWLWAVLLAIAAAVAVVWAAVTYAPSGTARVAAILFSAVGLLGASWAGARATLGRALNQVEGALWETEVITAIGKMATITPATSRRHERISGRAASGQRAPGC